MRKEPRILYLPTGEYIISITGIPWGSSKRTGWNTLNRLVENLQTYPKEYTEWIALNKIIIPVQKEHFEEIEIEIE